MSHSQLLVMFLLTVESFSIFGCKVYNQSGSDGTEFIHVPYVQAFCIACFKKDVIMAWLSWSFIFCPSPINKQTFEGNTEENYFHTISKERNTSFPLQHLLSLWANYLKIQIPNN